MVGILLGLGKKALVSAVGYFMAKLLTEKVFVEVAMTGFKHYKNWTVNKIDDELYEIAKKAMEEEK